MSLIGASAPTRGDARASHPATCRAAHAQRAPATISRARAHRAAVGGGRPAAAPHDNGGTTHFIVERARDESFGSMFRMPRNC